MLSETPLVQELKLDIALSKKKGRPSREQVELEIKNLEEDKEIIHEESVNLLSLLHQ